MQVTRPDLVLETQSTTCEGYSNMYAALANSAGLPTSVVTGWARVLDNPTRDPRTVKAVNGLLWASHGWNAVKLDGKMYLLDPTWGTTRKIQGGKKDPKTPLNFDQFLVPAEAFVYIHLPNDPRWQLLKTPLTKKEQEELPILWPEFFRFRLQLGNAAQPVLAIRDSLLVTVEAPEDTVVTASLIPFANRADVKSLFVQTRGRSVEIRAVLPRAGVYEMQVHAQKKGETIKDAARVITYRVDAKGGNAAEYLPAVFADAIERRAYLYHPLTERVTTSNPQAFVLSAPKATDVLVINGGKRVRLQKRDDLFVGEVSLAAGEVRVSGIFPDDPKTNWGLYKFVAE
jgi:hypothetical protein